MHMCESLSVESVEPTINYTFGTGDAQLHSLNPSCCWDNYLVSNLHLIDANQFFGSNKL